MSSDLTVILRSGGTDGFFYSRHGGSHVDLMLRCGARSVLSDIRGLRFRPTPTPFFEAWMSGVVFVDADKQVVWFWSSQYPARSGLEHQLVQALLAVEWPGWSLRWLRQPAAQLAALLPDTPPDLVKLSVRAITPEAFAALQDEAWEEARAEGDLTALIEECGEPMVRGWMEIPSHEGAVCIVTPDGVHEVVLNDTWDCSALLGTGPAAIETLRARPHRPHEDFFVEDGIRSAYWIDPLRRTLATWQAVPVWSGGYVGAGWEGWSCTDLAGPQEMMRRLGRDPAVLLGDGVVERLRKLAERILVADSPRWPLAESLIATLSDQKEPDEPGQQAEGAGE